MLLLQLLCLSTIVKKFERLYFASTVTKDTNLKRNFEFLRRRYSTEVADLLQYQSECTGEGLKDEHLEFCLNKHLNVLYDEWLKNSRHFTYMKNIFRHLENVTIIYLRNGCCDEILKNVAKYCPNIVEIDAGFSDVSDNGVKYLCKSKNGVVRCPKLKIILIVSTLVTEYGAELLIRKLPSLEIIEYANVPHVLHYIHEENLIEFDELQTYNLIELRLCESECKKMSGFDYYTDVLKTCLTVCPKLEFLSCCISHEEQLNLFANSNLRRLILQCSLLYENINIDNFLKMSGYNFTHFNITDCTMSISALGVHCPKLKEFVAEFVVFTDDTYYLRRNFASLTECIFNYIEPSSNKGICLLLSSSPKLESVSFVNCILSPEMESQILMWCKNPCAKEISFHFVRLETEFLKVILLSCFSLQKMNVEDCYMDTDDANEKITKLSKYLPNRPKIKLKNLKMDLITEFSLLKLRL